MSLSAFSRGFEEYYYYSWSSPLMSYKELPYAREDVQILPGEVPNQLFDYLTHIITQ